MRNPQPDREVTPPGESFTASPSTFVTDSRPADPPTVDVFGLSADIIGTGASTCPGVVSDCDLSVRAGSLPPSVARPEDPTAGGGATRLVPLTPAGHVRPHPVPGDATRRTVCEGSRWAPRSPSPLAAPGVDSSPASGAGLTTKHPCPLGGTRAVARFEHTGEDFSASWAVEAWCKAQGFAIGSMQGDAPQGLSRDRELVQKWRNLSLRERRDLDGCVTWEGRPRNGAAVVWLREGVEVRRG